MPSPAECWLASKSANSCSAAPSSCSTAVWLSNKASVGLPGCMPSGAPSSRPPLAKLASTCAAGPTSSPSPRPPPSEAAPSSTFAAPPPTVALSVSCCPELALSSSSAKSSVGVDKSFGAVGTSRNTADEGEPCPLSMDNSNDNPPASSTKFAVIRATSKSASFTPMSPADDPCEFAEPPSECWKASSVASAGSGVSRRATTEASNCADEQDASKASASGGPDSSP
mmetsp:Transcript_102478/g.293993  ORF Transcript_102478/g.293993 Transcript_102478/m.293993 type:complete len:226 (+) Transcript_102478:1056-1733(+)